MAIRPQLQLSSLHYTQGTQVHQEPLFSVHGQLLHGSRGWRQDQCWTKGDMWLLPGCQARQLFRRKAASILRAAKTTQKETVPNKGGLCPAAAARRLQPHPHPTQTTRTLSRWYRVAGHPTSPPLLVMERTEQWPLLSLTGHIWVTNNEQARPYVAAVLREKLANSTGEKTQRF